ncbi:hypothetical protein ACWGI1_25100 [Streptomyces sp. NPDC054835]|uniref:hypothetical protein n=1 Tax=Streptomyces sp. NBC_01268 TaxID=2903806 RepID=UPI002E2EE6AD|nr:hypothetical protein [Streptomyces sp. NBC_01268]
MAEVGAEVAAEGAAARTRRLRRAGILGGAIGGGIGGAGTAVQGLDTGFPWWVVGPFVALGVTVGVLAGVRHGREDRAQKDSLEPHETVLNVYGVWRCPAPPRSGMVSPENAPYQLHTTTRHLQFWKGEDLVWAHPWHEVRAEADGPLLRVLRAGVEIALVEQPAAPGMPEEFCFVAERIAARFGRR